MRYLLYFLLFTGWVTVACNRQMVSEGCIDQSKVDPDIVCTTEYAPVCGCDGATYTNECEARKKGLTSWKQGPCSGQNELAEDCIDESKLNPDRPCTMEYAPVCGCDGKTYSNACRARNSGVTSWEKGPCTRT